MNQVSKNKLSNLISYLKEAEDNNLFVFLVITFAIGIGTYFSLPKEPDFNKILLATGFSTFIFVASYFARKHLFYPALFLFVFSIGFFVANSKSILVNAPKIQDDIGFVWIRGKLDDIDSKDGFYRIHVSDVDLWQPNKGKFEPNETPQRIRLNVRTGIAKSVNEGDYIKVRAKLSSPSKLPVYPQGYDFGRYAYFDQIGAVGYSVNEVEVFKDREQGFFRSIRNFINNKIDDNILQPANKEILKALITAERQAIPKEEKEIFRESGLGHVLAISGMHMSIACLWFFMFLRNIFALFPKIALNYNTKKISASFALILGFFYLMITNMPVSATRAYFMIFLFLCAMFLDRNNMPLRPVALAAIVILIFQPELLVTPSFQMSFASVIALIGIYRIYADKLSFLHANDCNIMFKIFLYLVGISLTTLIASTFTSPFAVYHFGKIPKYSILANLAAIPVLTFIVRLRNI